MQEIKVTPTNNPEFGYTDKDELLNDVIVHRNDVSKVLSCIALQLVENGLKHDWTKTEYFDDFARDTLERQEIPEFKERDWYKIHTSLERHHITANAPVDVDLLDLLEFICDCIIAGKTRSGDVNLEFLNIDDNLLRQCYTNTVLKLMNIIQI